MADSSSKTKYTFTGSITSKPIFFVFEVEDFKRRIHEITIGLKIHIETLT